MSTLRDKVDFMKNLLILRVGVNHDNDILQHLNDLVANHSEDEMFENCQEWDDLFIALAAEKVCLLKIEDWYLKAIECIDKGQPIPVPPMVS